MTSGAKWGDDLNTRAAFLHVLGDALASVGVISVGAILLTVNWTWLDPLVSMRIETASEAALAQFFCDAARSAQDRMVPAQRKLWTATAT